MRFLQNNLVSRFFRHPMVLGLLLTAAFYTAVHQPRLRDTVLNKYTTEHITEYIVVALFCWAISDLTLRFLNFGRERLGLARDWLPPRAGVEPAANATELLSELDDASPRMQDTKIGRRLRLALTYVSQRKSADGFRDYLQNLTERDADATHANYSIARFVVGITPVLGLLGTVVHFGSALGGLSSDKLMERLPGMVSGMGTAFNTTCVALSVSMLTMFFLFVIERVEEHLDQQVNHRVESELLNRFATTDTRLTPFLDAVESSQQTTLTAMQQFQRKHLEIWTETLTAEQHRWAENDQAREEQLRQLFATFERRQSAHKAEMETALERVAELNQTTAKLAEMLCADGRLLELQGRLADNLELLHRSQQFDQAMQGLTAAIHILTARQPHLSPSARAA